MFLKGTILARERGVEQNLFAQWLGTNIKANLTVDNAVLSLGQLIAVFVSLMAAVSTSLAILGSEWAYFFFQSRFGHSTYVNIYAPCN
jgi:hypothetical protein